MQNWAQSSSRTTKIRAQFSARTTHNRAQFRARMTKIWSQSSTRTKRDLGTILWAIDEKMGTHLQAFYKHFYIGCLKTQKQQLHFALPGRAQDNTGRAKPLFAVYSYVPTIEIVTASLRPAWHHRTPYVSKQHSSIIICPCNKLAHHKCAAKTLGTE